MSLSTQQICNQINLCLLPNKKYKATSLLIKRTIKDLYEKNSILYSNEQKKFEIDNLDEEQIWFQIQNQVNKYIKQNYKTNNFEKSIQELEDFQKQQKQKSNKIKQNNQEEISNSIEQEEMQEEEELQEEEVDENEQPNNEEYEQEGSYQKEDLDGFLNFTDNIDSGKVYNFSQKNKEQYAQLYEDIDSQDDEEDGLEDEENSEIFNEGRDDYDEEEGSVKKSQKSDQSQDNINDQDIENDVFEEQRENYIEQTKKVLKIIKKTKLDEQIDKLEDKLIQKKDWQLQGEVTSKSRPVNSLLEEHLDFNKQEAQISKEFTENLEKIIKQRIIDEAWDDRTVNLFIKIMNPADYMQETFNSVGDLNFEKNKLGLSEEYENQFKKDVLNLNQNTEEDKLKREIEYAFKTLSYTLDNLSNLNFTPKSVVEQAQIITNVPSMKKEEKIPIFVSEKMQKAPQELFDTQKQGRFESKIELNAEENQKNHRKKLHSLKAKIKKTKKKDLQKKLDYTGQTKFEYNQVTKAASKLKKQVENKKEQSVKFTKSNQFFDNLQKKNNNQQIDVKPQKQKNYKL